MSGVGHPTTGFHLVKDGGIAWDHIRIFVMARLACSTENSNEIGYPDMAISNSYYWINMI